MTRRVNEDFDNEDEADPCKSCGATVNSFYDQTTRQRVFRVTHTRNCPLVPPKKGSTSKRLSADMKTFGELEEFAIQARLEGADPSTILYPGSSDHLHVYVDLPLVKPTE